MDYLVTSSGRVMYWGPKTSTDVAKRLTDKCNYPWVNAWIHYLISSRTTKHNQLSGHTFLALQLMWIVLRLTPVSKVHTLQSTRNLATKCWMLWRPTAQALCYMYWMWSLYDPVTSIFWLHTLQMMKALVHFIQWALTGHTLYQTGDVWFQ